MSDSDQDREFRRLVGELDQDGNPISVDPAIHWPNGIPGQDDKPPPQIAPVHEPAANGTTGGSESSQAGAALDAARVDLIKLIRDGLPERQFVPGCEPWLIRGKRYLMPAPAGTGKSLAAMVIALEVVAHGGTVAILDVENGAEEYAARLADVLANREPQLAEACSERLRYYAWPTLRADWGAGEWAAALSGADLVEFDSSRLVLSQAGLAEDSNDDYATFVNALLIPLARAGITTLVLDNTGHDERERARGASTKSDLNEVVYLAKVAKPFDRDQAGELRLVRKRQRFSDLPAQLALTLGGGDYRPPVPVETDATQPFRPTNLMEKISRQADRTPGLGHEELLALVPGNRNYKSQALALLVAEGYIRREKDGKTTRHHATMPYQQTDDECP